MAVWEPGDKVFEAAVHPRLLPHPGDDPDGEGVTPDGSEVLAEQIGGSLAIAGGRGADDLDVVAFPVHLPATLGLARGPGNGVQVGEGELERRISFDGQTQRCQGLAVVDGSLCLAVPRRGPRAGADRAAVVLDGRPGGVQVILLPQGLSAWWLHGS